MEQAQLHTFDEKEMQHLSRVLQQFPDIIPLQLQMNKG